MIYQYPHPEQFETFIKPDFKKYSGNIILWGAGKIGGIAEHCLKKRKIEIIGFCDMAEDKWETEFCGHTVISPQKMKALYPDATIIISTVFYKTIVELAQELGYERIFDCTSLFLEIDFQDYDFWMLPNYAIRNVEQYMATVYEQVFQKNGVDQIFLNITTYCSLRCRDCSMFIPYVQNPCFYNTDTINADLAKILNAFGHIRIVNFYGGEPLLHKRLADMILALKDEKRIDRISIITNATIVPDEKLLTVLENEKRIWLRISDYGKLSSKMDALKKVLEERHIMYEVANYAYWDAPSKIAPTEENEEELIFKFQQCTAGNNLFFVNRKVYLCSTGCAVDNIGAFPPSETNYVDIEKDGEDEYLLKEKLFAFMERPKNGQYINACHYCSGSHCVQFEDKHPVAVQTKEQLYFDKLY